MRKDWTKDQAHSLRAMASKDKPAPVHNNLEPARTHLHIICPNKEALATPLLCSLAVLLSRTCNIMIVTKSDPDFTQHLISQSTTTIKVDDELKGHIIQTEETNRQRDKRPTVLMKQTDLFIVNNCSWTPEDSIPHVFIVTSSSLDFVEDIFNTLRTTLEAGHKRVQIVFNNSTHEDGLKAFHRWTHIGNELDVSLELAGIIPPITQHTTLAKKLGVTPIEVISSETTKKTILNVATEIERLISSNRHKQPKSFGIIR